MSKKEYCYSDRCKPNVTGFNISSWKVCSECKRELGEELYDRLKRRQEANRVETPYPDYSYADPTED
jgi:hypothetical protein